MAKETFVAAIKDVVFVQCWKFRFDYVVIFQCVFKTFFRKKPARIRRRVDFWRNNLFCNSINVCRQKRRSVNEQIRDFSRVYGFNKRKWLRQILQNRRKHGDIRRVFSDSFGNCRLKFQRFCFKFTLPCGNKMRLFDDTPNQIFKRWKLFLMLKKRAAQRTAEIQDANRPLSINDIFKRFYEIFICFVIKKQNRIAFVSRLSMLNGARRCYDALENPVSIVTFAVQFSSFPSRIIAEPAPFFPMLEI